MRHTEKQESLTYTQEKKQLIETMLLREGEKP